MSPDKAKIYSLEIPSILSELSKVEKFTEQVSESAGFDEEERDNIAIAVTEVVNNAIIHGNKKDPAKIVFIDFTVSKDIMVIEVKDQGNGFDLNNLADPLTPENILKDSGRGIFISCSLMDSVDFQFSPEGTTVILKKKL